ncbi:MAG TPA: FKBP-type peptidyl-prolyl cis-trans isomerase [Chitinophagaceae bacterium]|nr:FKBP-type peptidyl-prolyl cis-trans isomerase [Chitinophagaceae bacterium]
MKKIVTSSILFFTATLMYAQNSSVKKPVAKNTTTNTTLQLKTLEDSANYAMGLSVANFYKQQGVTKINSTLVTRGISDAMSGKPALLNDAQTVLMTYLDKQQMTKSKPNIDACNNFLAANKNKQGIVTTASGLQYEVITQGSGPKPTDKDTVVCNYKGTFLDGREFDNSYKRGTPIEFAVTRVIRGWTEVLQLMPAGSKYKVYVPYQLGYGNSDYNGIPGGSLLIFEIELLSVKGK